MANTANGDDNTPVQVGRVLGKSREQILEERAAARAASLARGGRATNIREGDAQVGFQAGDITGDITVIM